MRMRKDCHDLPILELTKLQLRADGNSCKIESLASCSQGSSTVSGLILGHGIQQVLSAG